jgi:hypothetical protein
MQIGMFKGLNGVHGQCGLDINGKSAGGYPPCGGALANAGRARQEHRMWYATLVFIVPPGACEGF